MGCKVNTHIAGEVVHMYPNSHVLLDNFVNVQMSYSVLKLR